MHYKFPTITHIDIVREAIKNFPEFIEVHRDGFKVINYVTASNFPQVVSGVDQYDQTAAILRECRGLIFNDNGHVLSRRLHKFFNVNERQETLIENIDFSLPHVILEKLDGSMITPIVVRGNVRWASKMGITDVAMQVECFVADKPQYSRFAKFCYEADHTPIFEWVSRQQRIVIDHPIENLILVAIRNNVDGSYIDYETMVIAAEFSDMPVVKKVNVPLDNLVDYVHHQSGTEGIVIRFDDGHMCKVKTSWYVAIHKAKEKILREKTLIPMILENNTDDVKPYLPQHDRLMLEKFEIAFTQGLYEQVVQFVTDFNMMFTQSGGNRKHFALNGAVAVEPIRRSIMFALWDNSKGKLTTNQVYDEFTRRITNGLSSTVKIEQTRCLWGGVKWNMANNQEQYVL